MFIFRKISGSILQSFMALCALSIEILFAVANDEIKLFRLQVYHLPGHSHPAWAASDAVLSRSSLLSRRSSSAYSYTSFS